MKICLNEGETLTVCMNHKKTKETEHYTFIRCQDDLLCRVFPKHKSIEKGKNDRERK